VGRDEVEQAVLPGAIGAAAVVEVEDDDRAASSTGHVRP
jgi:hypothetical protein